MPESKDPIVYRYSGAEGESLTGIPARSLRQSDLDAMDDDQKKLLKAHVEAEYLSRHVFRPVESAEEPTREASQSKAGAKAADQKKEGS
jgi:hypothetical protein